MSDAQSSHSTDDDDSKNSLVNHLVELRGCLLRAIAALFVAFIATFPFADYVYSWLAKPLLNELTGHGDLIATGVLDPFLIQITTSFFIGFWITLPYIMFEMWRFVAPGLYQREKKMLLPLIVSSFVLFTLGMAFAYFLVFKVVFTFIQEVKPEAVRWTPDIMKYFSFMVKTFIGFGLAFETPVAVFILVRSGMVELETMRRARRYVIVGAFVFAAIITPPDVVSQVMLALPCWLLYEVGLLIAPKKKVKPAKPADD